MSEDWDRCSPTKRCPKCDHTDWCQVSKDGTVCMCMRVSDGSYKSDENGVGQTYYLHRLIEDPERRPLTAKPSGKIADANTRHQVYDALLRSAQLNNGHRDNLINRKAPQPFGGSYGTLGEKPWNLAARLRDRFPDETLLSIPGFKKADGTNGPYLSLAGRGMMIAVRDAATRIVAIKIRVDGATADNRYKWLSSRSWGGPGPGAPCHVPLGVKIPCEVVRLTEGPLKADIAFALSGFPTIGADSATTWKPAIPVLKTLGARVVRLAFDADATANHVVGRAVLKCARAIEEAGMAVEVEIWPAEVNGTPAKGIDDLLAAGGTPQVLTGGAAQEWLDGLLPEPVDSNGELNPGWTEVAPTTLCEPGESEDFAALAALADREAGAESPENSISVKSGPRERPTECDESDLGNGRLLAKLHGDKMRFCPLWDEWLIWDGARWQRDETGAARRLAQDVADLRFRFAISSPDSTADNIKFAESCSNTARITAMLREAAVQFSIAITHEDLDRNPWLLNCPNGTVDLRTGELRPHCKEDLITKLCPTNYNPEAGSYNWDRFLEGIFAGSSPLVDFMQRFLGYSLTGEIQSELLPIFYGVGSNGKTTLIEAYQDAIGPDYTMAAEKDLLMSKEKQTHPTERADLFGKRFVSCVETGSGKGLDETLVKQLTGRDKIRARRMFENFWQFDPTHKLILCTNHKPRIKGTDHGIWRRVCLVPFTQIFWDADERLAPPSSSPSGIDRAHEFR